MLINSNKNKIEHPFSRGSHHTMKNVCLPMLSVTQTKSERSLSKLRNPVPFHDKNNTIVIVIVIY